MTARIQAKPDVNEAIGARMRRRRIDLGVSQAELGARLGLSFQQIQKYERGFNRISSALLLDVAKALACPPTVLLGVSDTLPPDQAWILSLLGDEDASAVIRKFAQIKSPRVRKRVLTIVDAILSEDGLEKDFGVRQRAPKSPPAKRQTTRKTKRKTSARN